MSLEAIIWSYEQTATKGVEKFVLVTMADYCDEHAICNPSARKIAAKTGISRDSVRSHLRKLESKGLIRRETKLRENGSQSANRYELPISGGYEVLHTPASAHTLEPSTTDNGEQLRVQGGEQTTTGAETPTAFETWLADYREVTGRTKMRGSQSAKVIFIARLAEGYSLDDLKLATRGAHGDDWMRVRGLDVPVTILRPKNIDRYIELARQNGATSAAVEHRVEQGVPQISRDGGETWETDWEAVG